MKPFRLLISITSAVIMCLVSSAVHAETRFPGAPPRFEPYVPTDGRLFALPSGQIINPLPTATPIVTGTINILSAVTASVATGFSTISGQAPAPPTATTIPEPTSSPNNSQALNNLSPTTALQCDELMTEPTVFLNARGGGTASKFSCDMFGGLKQLEDAVKAMRDVLLLFSIIETSSSPTAKSDEIASINDFLQSINWLTSAAQSVGPVSKETAAMISGIQFWADNFKFLSEAYPDSQLPDAVNQWVTYADVRWMLARLSILYFKCKSPGASVTPGKRCCTCTYSEDEESKCNAWGTSDTLCRLDNLCKIGPDKLCHNSFFLKCNEHKKEKNLNGSCNEIEVLALEKLSRTPPPVEFVGCEHFFDVHLGHSWADYFTYYLPLRLSRLLEYSPNAHSYTHDNLGCNSMTDGNCNVRPNFWVDQITSLISDTGLDNITVQLTGNQDYALGQSFDPVLYQCSALTVHVAASNGTITSQTRYSPCSSFKACKKEGQIAQCHRDGAPRALETRKCVNGTWTKVD